VLLEEGAVQIPRHGERRLPHLVHLAVGQSERHGQPISGGGSGRFGGCSGGASGGAGATGGIAGVGGGLDGGLLELADGLGAALMFGGPFLDQRMRNTGPLVVRPSTFFSVKPRRKRVALFRVANAVSIPTGLVRVIEVLAPVLFQLDDSPLASAIRFPTASPFRIRIRAAAAPLASVPRNPTTLAVGCPSQIAS